ncbi:MAG: non-heme iron oxygenase ferredoxin subunit [Euryarchaeota archaeon]|nr:non-heme iron oxygenase ferredoxin subunit [Euryarchaeota archaeon]
MVWVAVGPASEVPPGRMKGYDVEGWHLILVNLDGEFHALSGICTHAYSELDKGFFAGEYVTCALHLSQFEVRTGEPISPPATEPLPKYPVKVEGETVYVDLPEAGREPLK